MTGNSTKSYLQTPVGDESSELGPSYDLVGISKFMALKLIKTRLGGAFKKKICHKKWKKSTIFLTPPP